MEFITKIVRAAWDFYHSMESVSDPRTKDWPLCGSPFPMLPIIFAYLCFSKVIGPRWMEKRKPFRLESLMIAYNVLMIVASTFFFLRVGSYTYFGKYSWICEPVDKSNSPFATMMRNLAWWYLILRIFEMTDTVFFVLRKKFNQISNLHVIHHSVVPFDIWLALSFNIANGNSIFFPLLNCFVHMIMYSYYFLSSLGPRMQKYLWWKKYLTLMQMGQFVVVAVHDSLPFFYDCGFPLGFCAMIVAEAIFFLGMFANFYYVTYKRGKSRMPSDRVQMNGKSPPVLTEEIVERSLVKKRRNETAPMTGVKQDNARV